MSQPLARFAHVGSTGVISMAIAVGILLGVLLVLRPTSTSDGDLSVPWCAEEHADACAGTGGRAVELTFVAPILAASTDR